jgi:hypothetical protein
MTTQQLAIVNDQLSNNENASDAELVDFLCENGLGYVEAVAALKWRPTFRTNPLAELRYDDYREQFVLA